jgi:tripartite-type tricarboxylate transporter receptor subunit TctC
MMGRPIFAPPGIPAERTRALRQGFEKTMKDPAFIADRKAVNEEVNSSSAEEVEALLKTLFETPKELVEETKTIIAAK